MPTEMGEYVVGAYLRLEEGCDFVDYNVRSPGGGLAGLNELDVVGLSFPSETAILCEVTTHVRGLLYGAGNRSTVERIARKHRAQRDYANRYLGNFQRHRFMFWSPVVPVGYMTRALAEIEGLESVINGDYKRRVDQLRMRAKRESQDTGNPFFRALQILESLRGN